MASVKFMDREYRLPDQFTNGEVMEMERIAGMTFSEMQKAFEERRVPYGFVVAQAKVAMTRSGVTGALELLLGAEVGSVEFIGDTPAEAAPSPPETPVAADTVAPATETTGENDGRPSLAVAEGGA